MAISLTSRVLIVEDHAGWREYLRSVLESHGWQVVGEAVDGWEGIEKALSLQPDIVLLDIGLPQLDGIKAARCILAFSPSTRILFVSDHCSPEIIQVALETASGFVAKVDVVRDLRSAIAVVLDGARFVSGSVAGDSEKNPGSATAGESPP